jgi:hypothetical protein
MTRRTKAIAAAAFAGLVALCFFLASEEGGEGPIYHGKPLSHWVDIYGVVGNGFFEPEAEDGIKSAGTNAFPYLIRWIQWDRVPLGARLPRPVARLIYNQNPEVVISRRARRIVAAVLAFVPLRDDATPAIVEQLERLMNTAAPGIASDDVGHRAFAALITLRPRGLVPLVAVIENPKHPMRLEAVAMMAFVDKDGLDAAMFAPGLLRCLDATDARIPPLAAEALGHLRAAGAAVVPLLIAHLNTTDDKLKIAIVAALGDFPAEAVISLPALTNLLSDPEIASDARLSIARLTANTQTLPP